MKKLSLIVSLLFSFSIYSFAQDCSYLPADCPDEASIEYSQSGSVRTQNGLLPQEIAMQDSMRLLVTPIMTRAAQTLHWQIIELDEVTNLDPFQSSTTPYGLRSPRSFGIAFEFIVNKDSLHAWRSWKQDFIKRYLKAGTSSLQEDNNIQNDPLYRQYFDSVQYYTQLYTTYLTAHPHFSSPDEQRAKYLLKQQDHFINKMNKMRENPRNASGESLEDMDKEKKLQTLRFRKNTLVEVFFNFNEHIGLTSSEDMNSQVGNVNITGTAVSKFVHQPEPDLNSSLIWHFDNWENRLMVLLGNWILKPTNGNYSATFSKSGQEDEHTPKKIKSDKVQTIAINIVGNHQNINKILSHIDLNQLNRVIVKD